MAFIDASSTLSLSPLKIAKTVVKNNIFVGMGTPFNLSTTLPMTNFAGDPQFVNAAGFDYHLKPTSPCVNAGMDPGLADPEPDGVSRPLAPTAQYVHPASAEGRVAVGAIDIGAFELGGGNDAGPPDNAATSEAGADASTSGAGGSADASAGSAGANGNAGGSAAMGAGGGAGSSTGGASAMGAGGGPGSSTDASVSPAAAAGDNGGCGCRVGASSPSVRSGAAILLALTLSLSKRRRGRR